MEKVYISVMLFAFVCFLFPIMYTEGQNANITDPGLSSMVAWMPFIILIICAVLPAYFYIEEKHT